MIIETLIDFWFAQLRLLFGAFELISLPTDLINTLSSVLAYGTWIVGTDIMALFVGSVVFWWVFKMSIGLIVWVWDRLPLT